MEFLLFTQLQSNKKGFGEYNSSIGPETRLTQFSQHKFYKMMKLISSLLFVSLVVLALSASIEDEVISEIIKLVAKQKKKSSVKPVLLTNKQKKKLVAINKRNEIVSRLESILSDSEQTTSADLYNDGKRFWYLVKNAKVVSESTSTSQASVLPNGFT